MLRCQGPQNILLSNQKLKSALKCTVWSQCTTVPDRQTNIQMDRRTNIMATAWRFVLMNASCARNWQAIKLSLYRIISIIMTVILLLLTLSPSIPLRLYTLPYWSNTTIFNFRHSGTLALRTERQSARMSKIKNAGVRPVWCRTFQTAAIWNSWRWRG